MPKYTKRTYIDIAETLAQTKATKGTIDVWVKKFKADNSRFDEKRFRAYIKGLK